MLAASLLRSNLFQDFCADERGTPWFHFVFFTHFYLSGIFKIHDALLAIHDALTCADCRISLVCEVSFNILPSIIPFF